MKCRGKSLQLVVLLVALACNSASGAAVHRARGVDYITAKLIGSAVSPPVQHSGAENPNVHFLHDSWLPIQEDRQLDLAPQPRATVEAAPTKELESKGNDSKRSTEVEDSIAAVASQLLNSPQQVLDVRTPPAMKEQQGQAEPDKKWEQMFLTNVTLKGTAQTPLVVTKVPSMGNKTEPTSPSSPTRFPPRTTTIPNAANENVVEVTKRPVSPTAVKKPTSQIPVRTTQELVTTTAAPRTTRPVAVSVVKKTELVKNTVVKPVAAIPKRPAATFTILKKNNETTTVLPAVSTGKPALFVTTPEGITTTRAPVTRPTIITESIPVVTTARKPATKPTTTKPSIFRQPSASVVTKAPAATSTYTPRFEILSTQKASTVAATIVRTTSSTAAATATTTTPVPTTTVKTKRKSSNKKNKKRRRRPSKKPANKIDLDIEEKEDKPLTSRIIDYLSGDTIPSFGTTVVGLLMTAGLAGLLFFPMEGFTRRSDQFKREEEMDGLVPSILKAVYTSLNPPQENDLYTEEQGPRRVKRQYRFEGVPYRPGQAIPAPARQRIPHPMYKLADSTNIMQIESGQQPFSVVRLVKQMLAVKLDVLSNVLRMASEQLRNYAQNADFQRPKHPATDTSLAEDTTDNSSIEVESSTTDVPTAQIVPFKSQMTETPQSSSTVPTTTMTELFEYDEENLVGRQTDD